MERHLAAIVAADLVGYSRLMGGDEAGTLVSLKARLEDPIQPRIAGHSAHVVKLVGGGVLVESRPLSRTPTRSSLVVRPSADIDRGLSLSNDERHG